MTKNTTFSCYCWYRIVGIVELYKKSRITLKWSAGHIRNRFFNSIYESTLKATKRQNEKSKNVTQNWPLHKDMRHFSLPLAL